MKIVIVVKVILIRRVNTVCYLLCNGGDIVALRRYFGELPMQMQKTLGRWVRSYGSL